ncbi:MAG: c-type cytochrome [Rickettsiella sp.]|nr:c-type cytochrome [Rickettsiella sp.]
MDYRIFFLLCFFSFFSVVAQSSVKTARMIESTLSHCAVCHGSDGNASVNKAWPKLAGQNPVYLIKSLKDFRPQVKNGRINALMNAIVVSLSEKEMLEIANYYANLPGSIDAAQAQLVPLGQKLYRGGNSIKGIPACLACHGPAGLGNPPAGFPRLSGQHMAYVSKQLKAFRSGERVDTQHQMMSTIAKNMSDADIEAVASYISGLYF